MEIIATRKARDASLCIRLIRSIISLGFNISRWVDSSNSKNSFSQIRLLVRVWIKMETGHVGIKMAFQSAAKFTCTEKQLKHGFSNKNRRLQTYYYQQIVCLLSNLLKIPSLPKAKWAEISTKAWVPPQTRQWPAK